MSDNGMQLEIYGRVFTIKTSSCGCSNDEADDVTVYLSAEASGTFLAGKRLRVFDREVVSRHKFKVPYDWAVDMRRRLSGIKVPAFPYMVMGCDGGFTELRAGGYDGSVHYRWWSGAPEGWEALDSFAWSVISLSICCASLRKSAAAVFLNCCALAMWRELVLRKARARR